jgi:GAF domain-containing protein/ActR/RegA family two-component response regulator
MKREVLLIEDDANYRKSITFMFRGESYQFVEAGSPEEGISLLRANSRIRVILLDLSFRNSSGTAVLDAIKERSDDYRVIVLTGHDELLRAERAGEYAVFNYLPKAQRSSKEAIRFSIDQAFEDLQRQHLDRKLRILLKVQQQVNASRETKETLDLICQAVRDTVAAYTCHIRVYDLTRGDYHLEGFAAPEEKMRHVFERPKAKGDLFSGRVVESGRPEVFDDLQSTEEFRRFAAAALESGEVSPEEDPYWRTVRSAYIAPISTGLFENAVDAVLNVSSELVGFFDEGKRSLVDEFVILAALTITKDWLHRKRDEIHQDYSHISKMLSDISDALRGGDVLRGIYRVVTRRISEIVNPEVVSILLYNESTGLLENVAELRGSEPVEAPKEVYRPGQSLTGSVYASDKTIQLPAPGATNRVKPLEDSRYDHANREGYLSNIPTGKLEHYLGVPIRIGGSVRGVLRAMNKKSEYYGEVLGKYDRLCLLERGFSADCRNVMEITASHLAVAIRNAELLNEKDRRVEQIRSLSEVGRLIHSDSSLEIDELLSLTIKQMAEVTHAEICMLFLKDREDLVVLRQSFGMPMIPSASYKTGEGVTGGVAHTGESRLIRTTNGTKGKYDAEIRAFLTQMHGEERGIESLMVVPIIAKGTTLGVMKVINKIGNHLKYDESDVELFQTFADYVAVAIVNAQIHEAERHAALSLSLLVTAVAHEINNTSGLIPANVAGIKAQLGTSNKDINRMLALIEDAASQATEFANELAGFSANRTGEKRPLDVNEVIGSAIEALQSDLSKYKNSDTIRLEVSLCERPLVCEIYRTPFIQIVRNIVINAFQALENKSAGVVRVSTSEGTGELTGMAVIQIEDDGPGIKPENRRRIFDPDFTTKPKGNGMGLWLVRTQLELIGGRVEVESESGVGAKFIVAIRIVPDGGGRLHEAPPSADR